MKVIVVDKIPLLKMMRGFFTLEFGIIDYDDVLDCLCSGIAGDKGDRKHVRNMVYGDAWLQGHHDPYSDIQKQRIQTHLWDLRHHIVRQIHHIGNTPHHLHFRYLIKYTSSMSLKFEVY